MKVKVTYQGKKRTVVDGFFMGQGDVRFLNEKIARELVGKSGFVVTGLEDAAVEVRDEALMPEMAMPVAEQVQVEAQPVRKSRKGKRK